MASIRTYVKLGAFSFLACFLLVALVSLLPHAGKPDDAGMVFRKEATVVKVHECFDSIDFIECRVTIKEFDDNSIYVTSVFNRVFVGRRVYDICRMDRIDGVLYTGCLNRWTTYAPSLFKKTRNEVERILENRR